MINLTIAIPTVKGREDKFDILYNHINTQIKQNKLQNKVEIISLKDDKEMSIGNKRQKLIEMAKGKFCVQIDDDDWVENNYVEMVNSYIEEDETIDCIGYYEMVTGFGKSQTSCISNMWEQWGDNEIYNGSNFRYVRSPFYKIPILTKYLLKVGIKDMRFGEDQDLSNRLKKSGLIKNEYLIERVMIHYRFKYEEHTTKYGFNK